MKTKMPQRLLVIAVLILVLVLTACGPEDASTLRTPGAASPTPEGGAPQAVPEKVSRSLQLDPATTEDTDSLAISGLVYDGLVRLDSSGNPQPALAIRWTVSADKLDYVLDLRQGVSFHSGAPFNADAVLANFNRWFDPEEAAHGDQTYPGWLRFFLGYKGEVDPQGVSISPFDGIEKVDNQTVLIHLNRPEPDFLKNLAQPYFAILDPAVLASGSEGIGSSVAASSGTGAYVLSAWTDSGLVLTPNVGYWGETPAAELQIGWR